MGRRFVTATVAGMMALSLLSTGCTKKYDERAEKAAMRAEDAARRAEAAAGRVESAASRAEAAAERAMAGHRYRK